ncbi:hypothetical protein Ddye_025530 [Dipteronia dyeriana]|uniref:Disease resistance protein At4g27190-like leucine-rich repeats domain-containing protein n=1 Tax=Dipteronia dyeriana TaxID=168575 RepID=A0AAD9TLI4_9ROSI|nr:hypothetical protein Ddye_025530 [Dipteronia dyeriana]
MKHIWNKDPRGMLSFENLQKIQVLECHNLKHLLPASVARSLSKLEYLSVFDCSVLKEIVAEEIFVEEAVATRFIFPRMATLELHQLPKLRTFYHGRHTIEGPVLKKLTLYDCDKVKIFPSGNVSKHETDKKQQQQPHFLVEKVR